MKLQIEELDEAFSSISKAISKIEKKLQRHLKKHMNFQGTVSIRRTGNKNIFYLVLDDGVTEKEYRLGAFIAKQKQRYRRTEKSFSSICQHGEIYSYYQYGDRGFLVQNNSAYNVTASNILNYIDDYLKTLQGLNTIYNGPVIYEITRVTDGGIRVSFETKYSDSLSDLEYIDLSAVNNALWDISVDYSVPFVPVP